MLILKILKLDVVRGIVRIGYCEILVHARHEVDEEEDGHYQDGDFVYPGVADQEIVDFFDYWVVVQSLHNIFEFHYTQQF